ncbi:unnamed protein product [Symbiodinium natans]|uniref:Uncharacterized protein n=1 Tax=Symbiodinium natans TaxID=878477 RepID=A0A812UV68_9DINO|nr:unnamed protein product [Symbiodinium natans]
MGKKVLQAGNMVAIFAVLGYVVCLFLPLHKAYFQSLAGFLRVVDVTTYSMTVYYDWHSRLACWFVRKIRGGANDMCEDEGSTSVWLQDTQASLCAEGVEAILTSACSGYGTAYVIGICMFLVVLLNVIAQGITFWLIQQYMEKPKKQYREVAFFLDLIGTILMLIVVLIYLLAIQRLSSISALGFEIALGPSNGIGASYGYFFLYFFIMIQGVSVVLMASGSNSQEAREAELREQRKFMQEMQMFDQATEMVNTNFAPQGVMAPPSNWQSPPSHWGNQQPMQPAYGGAPPMPTMTQPYGGHPHMGGPPQMGGAGPYF